MKNSSAARATDTLDTRLLRAMNDHRAGRLDEAEAAYEALVEVHPAKPEIYHLLGTIACRAGRWAQGTERFRAAIAAKPDYAAAHNDLGSALQTLGRHAEAVSSYTEAVVLDPNLAEAHYNLGTAFQALNRFDEALDAYRAALILNPRLADAHNNLGSLHMAMGLSKEAARSFDAAVALRPGYAEAWNNRGTVDAALGDDKRACEHYRKALECDPNHVDALINLGTSLHKLDRVDEAVTRFRTALKLAPEGHAARHTARARLRQAVGKAIPGWHFPMMNDAFRNQAYERAIQAAVTPDTHVLDIGTGSGLLSLMAARAGARRVTTCEMVKVVAAKARDIVARNGYENKITVVPLKSTDARIGHEIDDRADLLVSEILSSDLLGEGVLPALEHARAELLTPEAKIIPAACGVMGFLGGAEELESRNHVAEVAGFDLSPFNEFTPLRFSVRRQNYPYHRYSNDFEAMVFNLVVTKRFPAESKILRVPVTQTGRCQGVVQWIKCWLDDTTTFENHPDLPNPSSGWSQMFHAFPEPIDLHAGQTVRLLAEHDRINLFLHFDGVEG